MSRAGGHVRNGSRGVRFANRTEERFGELLARLRLRWEYEPHTFVLRTRSDGSTALAFTPDFYLPDLDLYFELTTLKQKLVTRKNRKARLLGEQRPDVRVRLLYRRDCQDVLRPVRTRRARLAMLETLLPRPPEAAVRRAAWLVYVERTGDAAGSVSVMGVRLPLGPEWAGRRFAVWVYPGTLEVEHDGVAVARFPCRYDRVARAFVSVEPGALLAEAPGEQAPLPALPELVRASAPGRRPHPRRPLPPTGIQLPLPM